MLAVCVAVKELPDTEWDSLGYLTRLSRSESQETISLAHDVFGNLATLTAGGQTTTFLWDDASLVPSLLKAGNQDVFTALGHTALGTPEHNTGWLSHGWRQARPTNPLDPWALPPVMVSEAKQSQGLSPWNVLLGGSISVFGLELMGARTYDPLTHSFLTRDPLPPVLGTPYAANPYEYAGNNPLTQLDPLGLKPLTDQELNNYATQYNTNRSQGILGDAKNWWDKYGDYVVAGALIVGGLALTAATFGVGSSALVGVAAYLGTSTSLSLSFAAVSTGVSAMSDKYRTGSVNWWRKGGEFAIDFGIGKLGGWAYEVWGVKAAEKLGLVSLETGAVQTVEQATVETISKFPVAAQVPIAAATAGGPYLVGEYATSVAEETVSRLPLVRDYSEPHSGTLMEGSTERFMENFGWSTAEDGTKLLHPGMPRH